MALMEEAEYAADFKLTNYRSLEEQPTETRLAVSLSYKNLNPEYISNKTRMFDRFYVRILKN